MTTQTQPQSRWKRAPFVVPLILVNVAALVGQSLWTYNELVKHFLEHHHKVAALSAVLMGLALESIAVYLAVQAHAAMMADQASGGLRAGSYAIGAVMAGLNLDHFSGKPVDSVALGVMFGLASLCSPWLWAVDSKAAHRAQLAARGIVDPRGVKLSTNRKFWHPVKSVKVVRHASWVGEMDPARAVEGWESARQSITQSAQTAQLRATIEVAQPAPVHEPVPAIEAPPVPPRSAPVPPVQVAMESLESTDESVTETVTETVTRTRTQTTTRTQARIQTLMDRVESVRVHEDFLTASQSQTELSYDQIGAIIGRTGRGVIGPVFQVLYRGQSAESVILGVDA